MNSMEPSETHMGYQDIKRIDCISGGARRLYLLHTPDTVFRMKETSNTIRFVSDNDSIVI